MAPGPPGERIVHHAEVKTTRGAWKDFERLCLDKNLSMRAALGLLVDRAIEQPWWLDDR